MLTDYLLPFCPTPCPTPSTQPRSQKDRTNHQFLLMNELLPLPIVFSRQCRERIHGRLTKPNSDLGYHARVLTVAHISRLHPFLSSLLSAALLAVCSHTLDPVPPEFSRCQCVWVDWYVRCPVLVLVEHRLRD